MPQTIPKLSGMFPILATPFHDDESIDFESLKSLIDYLIEQDVDGVVTPANASEGHLLNDKEKQALIAETLSSVNGRIPVVVGVTHFGAKAASENAVRAEKEGAAAVLTLPPFFGKWKSGVVEIREYLLRINGATDIPIMLQDHPLTDIALNVSDLCGLIEDVPSLNYLKMEVDTSADKIHKLMESAPDKFGGVFSGMGGVRLFWELEAGAVGCMPACIPAKPVADIIHLYQDGKQDESFEMFRHWLPFLDFMLRLGRRDIVKEYLVETGVIASAKQREPLITAWNDWCRKEFRYLLEKTEQYGTSLQNRTGKRI